MSAELARQLAAHLLDRPEGDLEAERAMSEVTIPTALSTGIIESPLEARP